jgi:carbon storage regulator
MLIIRCKEGETILVDSDIEIRILSVGPGRIKLGVVAPLDVQVVRKDLEVTRRQNVAAASASAQHLLNNAPSGVAAVNLFSNNLARLAQANQCATEE